MVFIWLVIMAVPLFAMQKAIATVSLFLLSSITVLGPFLVFGFQPLSDKNFGNIFSIWDRLFGTYISVDNSSLVYGLDTYMDEEDHKDIVKMLKIPFQPYRAPEQ